MLQLILLVYVLFKIYYLNKPLTGNPAKDNYIRKLVDSRANRSSVSRIVSLFLIALLSLATFVGVIILCKCFKSDGAYAFYGKSIDLNERAKFNDIPEEHSYVTLSFNMVGQEFGPIHSRTGSVYYPVVLENSGEKPAVFAIYVDEGEMSFYDEYIKASEKKIGGGKSDSGKDTIEVTGRIVNFVDDMENVYNTAVSNSGIEEADYTIRPMVINTNIDQKEERDRLVNIMAIVHALFTFVLLLSINELIDEGKLD